MQLARAGGSLNAAGTTEALYEGINVGDKDFSALIAKMKEAGVTIIYWGWPPPKLV